MGKHLLTRHDDGDDQFDEYHPGCMWGVLHALDYHHWHYSVKRILPHKKHDRRKHAKINANKRTWLDIHDCSEVQNLLEDDDQNLVNHTSKRTGTRKKSIISRIKELIAEEMSKEDAPKQRRPDMKSRLKLHRTYSIHHLEPLDNGLSELSTKLNHPFIFLQESADPAQKKAINKSVARNEEFGNVSEPVDINKLVGEQQTSSEKIDEERGTLGNQKLKQTEQPNGSSPSHRFENDDFFEIFRVNSKLIQELLENKDDGLANCFNIPKASRRKRRFTKSGSFPIPDLSSYRNLRPTGLEHKYNEIWSFPKGEKLVAGTRAPKLVGPKFSKDLYTKSGPLMLADGGVCELNPETNFSSWGSVQELDQQVISFLKDFKQRIECANEDTIEESRFISQDAILSRFLNRCNSSADGEEKAESSKDNADSRVNNDSFSSDHETDLSASSARKDLLTHVRRTSSLSDSLDRYARLFDSGLNREPKLLASKSLKLSNEYETQSGRLASKSTRRLHSLSNLDLYYSSQTEETCDGSFSKIPSRTVMDGNQNCETGRFDELNPSRVSIDAERDVPPGVTEEIDMVERTDGSLRVENLTVCGTGEGTAKINRVIEEKEEVAVQVFESCVQGVDSSLEISIPEDSGCGCNYIDERESSVDSERRCNVDIPSCPLSGVNKPNSENEYIGSSKNQKYTESCGKDDTDFNYVRAILEQSELTRNGLFGTWHSLDQPLSPSVFEEVEAHKPQEVECSKEAIDAFFHHQLLFDMINEILLQIHDKSLTYYPRALSFNCRIRPLPVGNHVLDEVWTSISKSLSLSFESEQCLDNLMAQDFKNEDGWMNLQMETECVALELEDWIFEELLEEAVYS